MTPLITQSIHPRPLSLQEVAALRRELSDWIAQYVRVITSLHTYGFLGYQIVDNVAYPIYTSRALAQMEAIRHSCESICRSIARSYGVELDADWQPFSF